MNKNIIYGVAGAVLLVILIVVGMNMSGKKNPTVKNTNVATTNTASPYAATLTINDSSVTPPDFTVALSQTIKVQLINAGTLTHSFTFSALDFNSGVIEPGATKVVTFTTPSVAGSYEY